MTPTAATQGSDCPQQFRKKPVVIEAMLFDGSQATASAISRWANAGDAKAGHDEPTVSYITRDNNPEDAYDMVIWTLEGDMVASKGDWIIRGIKGEFYPCKPDIFAMTYEPATHPAPAGGDAELLDWLEDRCHQLAWTRDGERIAIRADDGAEFTGDTWRDCIRSALTAKPGAEGES